MSQAGDSWWKYRWFRSGSGPVSGILSMVRILNGEWKEKGIEHPLDWPRFSAYWKIKEHMKQMGRWKIV